MLVARVFATARSLLRGDVGVDAIALVAIVWAPALGEFLTAVIVALMMSGGAVLEAWAEGRARRELRLLVERAPRIAHRYVHDTIEEVRVDELQPGDVVAVQAGEVASTVDAELVPTLVRKVSNVVEMSSTLTSRAS